MDYSEIVILAMEIIGTVAFASSGAMLAIKKHMDLFGVCVLGVLTAVGGGMTRDVILGNIPVALIKPVYVVASVVTAVVVFIAYYMKKICCRDRVTQSMTESCWPWIPWGLEFSLR